MAGKPRSKGPTPYLQRGTSEEISYEDILVAQYMNQIEKSPPKSKRDRDVPVSPYAIATLTGQEVKSRRPKSAVAARRKKRDPEMPGTWLHQPPTVAWEVTEDGEVEYVGPKPTAKPKRNRPMSAPVVRQRSVSVTSGTGSTFSHISRSMYSNSPGSVAGSTVRRNKPLYKKKPRTLCVQAFQNGNRDNYARVTAPDLQQLLDNCTAKLGLVSAARKLFLGDGEQVISPRQIKKDADIYVSCGEPFKDPYAAFQKREELRRSASWALTGIVLPEDKSRGRTKPSLSKRMRTLVESQKRRILCFRNGDSSEGVEIVAGRFDEFLDDCTAKLNLDAGARRLFDWEGSEVKSFADVPVLDGILQPSGNVVLGPVWVTKGGERFSPKGPYNFALTLLMNTRERIKYSKAYKEELETQLGDQNMSSSKEIMSMSKNEVNSEIKEVDDHICELASVVPGLKQQIKKLSESVHDETGTESYKFQHISEIDANSRLLGKQGLRLKVYENGHTDGEAIIHFNLREAEKGIQGDSSQLMHRFLDACTSSQRLGDGAGGPAGRRIAKRVFLKDGKEVKDIHELEYDQEIWLSYGEEFKQLSMTVLQLTLDRVSCMSLWDEKEIVQREPLMEDEKGQDKPTVWKVVKSFPPGTKRQLVALDMPGPQRLSYAQGLQGSRVDEGGYFLQSRERKNLVLYPEVSLEVKKKKGSKEVWPSDAQIWVITQSGLIYSKAMPQLALTRSERPLQAEYGDDKLIGCAVQLAKRAPGNPNQQWGFSATGQIYSISKPSLVLTHVGERHVTVVDPDSQATRPSDESVEPQKEEEELGSNLASLHFMDLDEKNGAIELEPSLPPAQAEDENTGPGLSDLKDEFSGQRYAIALFPKLPGKHPCSGTQRWAIKQEDLSTIGQWKHTTVSNPEWNKRALSWPVTNDGTWNTEFTWPMEGFLLPFAPPVKRSSEKKSSAPGSTTRLRVLRNGEADTSKAVIVVGPDLTNMWRDVNDASPKKKNKAKRSGCHSSTDVSGVYDADSCHPLDLKRLELELFMDQCTEALSLPFAARRLFDEEGRDVMCISDLSRDQLVFASCGESWTDPKLSYSDQQRRALLTNLASDIARIRQYIALRDPHDLVLGVEGPVVPGAGLIVNTCMLTQADREKLMNKPSDEEDEQTNGNEDNSPGVELSYSISAHERSHQRAEERLKSMRWSWENARTSKGGQSCDDPDATGDFEDEVTFSDPHLQKKFRRHSLKTLDTKTEPSDSSFRQRFHYTSDGFIHLKRNSSLVLGLEDSSESKSSNEVLLCKKKVEDPSQRWVISDDGSISLRSKPDLVLTVTTPPLGNDPFTRDEALDFGYRGSVIIVANRKSHGNGNAHQLWTYDRATGFIDAFSTDTTNKEITAANKANVCTYALLGPKALHQPGYVYMAGTSRERLVCDACGKASRGKSKLQRLTDTKRFSCALGSDCDSNGGSKLSGCFKCLNSKVDLSTLEADSTLELWEYQLERLRNEGSVRTITRELHVAKSVPAVRIMAYKNGEGSRSLGVLVIGSSIHTLLDQATTRLGLTQAARRLYTVRGEVITDIAQLVRPYDASMMTSRMEPQVLAEEMQNKVKIRENTPPIPNWHAVDYVEAENRLHYKSNGQQMRDKEDEVEEDDQSSGNETYRVEEGRKGTVPIVNQDPSELPRWDTRWPIDVWVSCGEPFVPLEEADKQYLLSMKHREERTWVQAYLDMEKHVLRQMQGRRITGISPPESPRGAAKTWYEPTRKEEKKEETIMELKKHLKDVKSRQKHDEVTLSKSAIETTQRLYSTPKTVRVKVYPNSETTERAVTVFGASIREILDNSTTRLDLSSAARRLFKQSGQEVESIQDIRRDEMLCVSCGEGFVQARDRRHQMELKATWSRMTRYGGVVLPGSQPVTASERFESPQLALPAPPSLPPRASPNSKLSSVHTLRGSGKPFHKR
ncbi:doublecortin domain-containing protein 1 [Nematostella vectensis]|uniref:doublecortin domain-containing protein 1 n=1 Tax=Nematostella vectensis TaxID=45351 RepID=UPI0020771956|nr:doublecortin domain-containing protein 1 [Nematostella vectensis]